MNYRAVIRWGRAVKGPVRAVDGPAGGGEGPRAPETAAGTTGEVARCACGVLLQPCHACGGARCYECDNVFDADCDGAGAGGES